MSEKRIFIKILCLSMIFIMVFTSFVFAQSVTKDETVYVNLNHEGEVKDVTVSDWLYSDQSDIEILDKSILTDIKNVKGEELPDIKGDILTWKTNKGEIYYQGKTKIDLPLSVEISYSLDGKKIDPELLAGKSGKFEMIINIKNNESHDVMINGKLYYANGDIYDGNWNQGKRENYGKYIEANGNYFYGMWVNDVKDTLKEHDDDDYKGFGTYVINKINTVNNKTVTYKQKWSNGELKSKRRDN